MPLPTAAWNSAMECAPIQEGALSLPSLFASGGAGAAPHFFFTMNPMEPGEGLLAGEAPGLVHDLQDSVRHELNLVALLACLLADQAARNVQPGGDILQPHAEVPTPNPEIVTAWHLI